MSALGLPTWPANLCAYTPTYYPQEDNDLSVDLGHPWTNPEEQKTHTVIRCVCVYPLVIQHSYGKVPLCLDDFNDFSTKNSFCSQTLRWPEAKPINIIATVSAYSSPYVSPGVARTGLWGPGGPRPLPTRMNLAGWRMLMPWQLILLGDDLPHRTNLFFDL